MQNYNNQLYEYKKFLKLNVKIQDSQLRSVASIIASEIEQKKDLIASELKTISPISLETRMEELIAFQQMMEIFNQMKPKPAIVRTQVVSENYFCFVYLKDSLFEVLKKQSEVGSVTKKCMKFLLNNPVRAFRNSVAHGNWKYLDDFSGIEFWARKGSEKNGKMSHFTVSQTELGFWKTLSKAIAYITFINVKDS